MIKKYLQRKEKSKEGNIISTLPTEDKDKAQDKKDDGSVTSMSTKSTPKGMFHVNNDSCCIVQTFSHHIHCNLVDSDDLASSYFATSKQIYNSGLEVPETDCEI